MEFKMFNEIDLNNSTAQAYSLTYIRVNMILTLNRLKTNEMKLIVSMRQNQNGSPILLPRKEYEIYVQTTWKYNMGEI